MEIKIKFSVKNVNFSRITIYSFFPNIADTKDNMKGLEMLKNISLTCNDNGLIQTSEVENAILIFPVSNLIPTALTDSKP